MVIRAAHACATTVAQPRARCGSALRVLRSLTGLLQAVLLTLDRARVPGQEAGGLQRSTILGRDLGQRTGDGQAHRTGLARRAAALQAGVDVEGALALDEHQRRLDQL